MCCLGNGPSGSHSGRCALLCGLAALIAIGVTIFSNAWIQTEERITSLPRNITSLVSAKFKIGFWHVCSRIERPAYLYYSEYLLCLLIFFYKFLLTILYSFPKIYMNLRNNK